MTLQEQITFNNGLKVGSSPVRMVNAGREVLAVVTLGKVGSFPRVSVLRGDALQGFVVKGDNMIAERVTRGLGCVEAFVQSVASPVATVVVG